MPGREPNEIKNIYNSTVRHSRHGNRTLLRVYAEAIQGHENEQPLRMQAYARTLEMYEQMKARKLPPERPSTLAAVAEAAAALTKGVDEEGSGAPPEAAIAAAAVQAAASRRLSPPAADPAAIAAQLFALPSAHAAVRPGSAPPAIAAEALRTAAGGGAIPVAIAAEAQRLPSFLPPSAAGAPSAPAAAQGSGRKGSVDPVAPPCDSGGIATADLLSAAGGSGLGGFVRRGDSATGSHSSGTSSAPQRPACPAAEGTALHEDGCSTAAAVAAVPAVATGPGSLPVAKLAAAPAGLRALTPPPPLPPQQQLFMPVVPESGASCGGGASAAGALVVEVSAEELEMLLLFRMRRARDGEQQAAQQEGGPKQQGGHTHDAVQPQLQPSVEAPQQQPLQMPTVGRPAHVRRQKGNEGRDGDGSRCWGPQLRQQAAAAEQESSQSQQQVAAELLRAPGSHAQAAPAGEGARGGAEGATTAVSVLSPRGGSTGTGNGGAAHMLEELMQQLSAPRQRREAVVAATAEADEAAAAAGAADEPLTASGGHDLTAAAIAAMVAGDARASSASAADGYAEPLAVMSMDGGGGSGGVLREPLRSASSGRIGRTAAHTAASAPPADANRSSPSAVEPSPHVQLPRLLSQELLMEVAAALAQIRQQRGSEGEALSCNSSGRQQHSKQQCQPVSNSTNGQRYGRVQEHGRSVQSSHLLQHLEQLSHHRAPQPPPRPPRQSPTQQSMQQPGFWGASLPPQQHSPLTHATSHHRHLDAQRAMLQPRQRSPPWSAAEEQARRYPAVQPLAAELAERGALAAASMRRPPLSAAMVPKVRGGGPPRAPADTAALCTQLQLQQVRPPHPAATAAGGGVGTKRSRACSLEPLPCAPRPDTPAADTAAEPLHASAASYDSHGLAAATLLRHCYSQPAAGGGRAELRSDSGSGRGPWLAEDPTQQHHHQQHRWLQHQQDAPRPPLKYRILAKRASMPEVAAANAAATAGSSILAAPAAAASASGGKRRQQHQLLQPAERRRVQTNAAANWPTCSGGAGEAVDSAAAAGTPAPNRDLSAAVALIAATAAVVNGLAAHSTRN
ncbi:hypothetical protein HXX76_000493 [Chlamydomonas incerta]|uniref:Uncharacterized protein n=1 Tax=Chlamydomonas incerta TaxID=51695 RepID=A0A835WE81_CHLIN|nr:hypothetical protein HXX76_000493 [Chlamydomonas incerta]|eukprot:KAG2445889.1 hypothetical protein HXX76_000493 [Chlamydomonas incerta]